jgi:hypothetical protein
MIETMPLKMLPITPEELEHIEDNWLDAEFERKLQQSGDNLEIIKNITKIAHSLFGPNSNGNNVDKGTVYSEVIDSNENKVNLPSAFGTEDISDDMPILPENPTTEELWSYAENHPFVKKALRIFRGKIIEVEKGTPTNKVNIFGT